MESKPSSTPLIVIVGETCSGKSALALELALRFNGEIIAADSRTVYRGLDVSTAKPSRLDQEAVSHHLLDVVSPDQAFNVATFKRLADEAIADITARGKIPILVGGSGLYIDAVLFNFSFSGPSDERTRQGLSSLSVPELQQRLVAANIPLPFNALNPRHLIRALETQGLQSAKASEMRPRTVLIGLQTDRQVLRDRLHRRLDQMLADGLVSEVTSAAKSYGWNAPGLQAPGFKAFKGYVDGELSLEQAKLLFIQNDLRLAKRQRTWFRRNKSIHWITTREEAVDLVTTELSK